MDQFPLYRNDEKWTWPLSRKQISALSSVKKDIENNTLKLVVNHCLCGNEKENDDIVISEKDRYGFHIPQVLCKKCGLIRSKLVFSEESNELFYKDYYRNLYTTGSPTNFFFFNQIKHGETFANILEKEGTLADIENVTEIGCGAGGILLPFQKRGKQVKGFDFNKEYLNFGSKYKLDLNFGDYSTQLEDDSCDLIILSHVLEHFLNPIKEIHNISKKIKLGKYLLVEIPSILNIRSAYRNPILYFQNAHVYNFYQDYLKIFFEALGFEIIYSDELCIFICKKVREVQEPQCIYGKNLEQKYQHIAKYFVNCQEKWQAPRNILRRIALKMNSARMLYRFIYIFIWNLTHKNFVAKYQREL